MQFSQPSSQVVDTPVKAPLQPISSFQGTFSKGMESSVQPTSLNMLLEHPKVVSKLKEQPQLQKTAQLKTLLCKQNIDHNRQTISPRQVLPIKPNTGFRPNQFLDLSPPRPNHLAQPHSYKCLAQVPRLARRETGSEFLKGGMTRVNSLQMRTSVNKFEETRERARSPVGLELKRYNFMQEQKKYSPTRFAKQQLHLGIKNIQDIRKSPLANWLRTSKLQCEKRGLQIREQLSRLSPLTRPRRVC